MSRPGWGFTGDVQLCPKDCPRRAVGCRDGCESWAEHERRKQERYRRRQLEHAADRTDDLAMMAAHEKKKRQR